MIGSRIFLITDPSRSVDTLVDVVRRVGSVLPRGSLAVQLRDKVSSRREVARLASRLRGATRDVGAALVINVVGEDDARIAADVAADGVHLGGGSLAVCEVRRFVGEGSWLSLAAHDDNDVRVACMAGADAVLVSPVFDVPGKQPARGPAALYSARRVVTAMGSITNVIALGGVAPANARLCVEAGADGVAVIRALLDADDPGAIARELDEAFTCSAGG